MGRDRIAMHADRVINFNGGQTIRWQRTNQIDLRDTYERDGYRVDVHYDRRGWVVSAVLTGPVGTQHVARRRYGLVVERVMQWLNDPTRFIKPPLGGVSI